MKQRIFSVYDVAAGMYKHPIFLRAPGEAVRMFQDLVVAGDNDVGKHPEDYSLVEIGEWDDGKGLLSAKPVEVLITGLEALHDSRQIEPDALKNSSEIKTAIEDATLGD